MGLGRDGKERVWGRDMGLGLGGILVRVLGGMELGRGRAWVLGDKGQELGGEQACGELGDKVRIWVLLRISHRQHI